jgi:hypothetical protein
VKLLLALVFFSNKHIEHQVDDPKGNEEGKYPFGEFRLGPCPLKITGIDSAGLKFTQGRGSTDRKTLGNSGEMQNCLATNIIQNTFYSKGLHAVW